MTEIAQATARAYAEIQRRKEEKERLRTRERDGEPIVPEALYEARNRFTICLTGSEVCFLAGKAEKAGMSISGYVRSVIKEASGG